MHCSLRYQGNFIVDTLERMKTYTTNIQNHRDDKDNFPGKYLYKGDNTSFKIKFILFTNIRLDFNPTTPPNTYEPTTNDNLREAYIRSVNFSNDLNPLQRSFGKSLSRNKSFFGSRRRYGILKKKYSKKKRSKSNKSKKLKKHIQFLKSIKGLIKI
jgi:hypothetical protein